MKHIKDLASTGYPREAKEVVDEVLLTGRRVSYYDHEAGHKITGHPHGNGVRIVVQEGVRPGCKDCGEKIELFYEP